MRKTKSVLALVSTLCVLFSAFSTAAYADAAEGLDSPDPSEQISVGDAIILLDQAFSAPDAPSSTERSRPGADWFDPALVMGRYDAMITRAFASFMLLSAAGIEAPPAVLYSASALPEIKAVCAAYLRDSFVSCVEMELFRSNADGAYEPNALIGRAELAKAVASLQTRGLSLPEADYVPGIGAEVYCFSDDDADYQRLLLQAALLSVPEALGKDFTESGWHIAVASESYYKAYVSSRYADTEYLTASGLFMPGEKTILLQNRATEKAVLHELGHYFDRYYTAGWDPDALYRGEVAALESLTKSSYCRESADEFIAEAFRIFVTAPGKMEKKCPLTFDYLNALLCDTAGEA